MNSNQDSHSNKLAAALFFLCLAFLLNDLYILKLDEKIGEIILCKVLGFAAVCGYLKLTGQNFGALWMTRSSFTKAGLLGLAAAGTALVSCFFIKFLAIAKEGGEPFFTLSSEYSWLTFFLFVLLGNIINSLMEETLFRGVIFQRLLNTMTFFRANLFQALIFGLWHISLTYKSFSLGETDMAGLISTSILYVIISGFMGFMMGYLVYKTRSLFSSIVWHTLWNGTLNILLIKSGSWPEDHPFLQNSEAYFFLAFIIINLIIMAALNKFFFAAKQPSSVSIGN